MDPQLGQNMFVWKPGRHGKQISKMPRRRAPSEKEWEAQKELILRLYTKDNMSRERAMKTMKACHGFEATDKMYKNRLRKWNVRKNLTGKMIPEIKRQQKPGNNPDLYVVGEQVWEAGRVERFFKRRSPPSQRGSRSLSLRSPFTPRPRLSPSPLPTSAPPEALFISIKTYFDAASPTFIWYKETQDRLCMSRTDGIRGRCRLSRFHDRLMVAVNSLTPQSIRVVDECMEEMREILSEQDPLLLPNIFHILVLIKKRLPPPQHDATQISHPGHRHLELDKLLVDYGKSFSTLELGEAHPLTAVWTILDRALKISYDVDMFSRALELVLNEFEAQLGPNHATSLIMRLHLFSSRGDDKWKQVLINLLTVLEESRGRSRGSAIRFFRLKWALENNNLSQEHVNRVTKLICRVFRARMYSAADGQVDLTLEDILNPDPESELVQCLYSPPVVMDADYLP